jgi:hypothetical protein
MALTLSEMNGTLTLSEISWLRTLDVEPGVGDCAELAGMDTGVDDGAELADAGGRGGRGGRGRGFGGRGRGCGRGCGRLVWLRARLRARLL